MRWPLPEVAPGGDAGDPPSPRLVVRLMPGSAQAELPDLAAGLDRFKRWKPAAQAVALEAVRQAELTDWHPFYCPNPKCNGQPHCWPAEDRKCPNPFGHEWKPDLEVGGVWACKNCHVGGAPLDDWLFTHSRPDQRPPRWKDDWLTLFLRGGRGSGKTRSGAEITNRVTKLVPRITLIGATGPDLRNIMVEGESGIQATSPPGEKPIWEPSKKQLTWPNGCIGIGYSAEEPDRLRGQNSSFIWCDEPAHWAAVELCWSNMLFGLRIGDYPKILATSTPKPTEWVKKQLKDKFTVDRVVSTYANLSNLSPIFRRTIMEPFEGTRTGRQELYGEVLEDVEGALWNGAMIRYVNETPELQRIVVSIDPAGTANKRSDLTGIIVIGLGHDKKLYVLADHSGKYSPDGWGSLAHKLYRDFNADAIVVERNFGEDMVTYVLDNTLRSGDLMPHVIAVRSRRGKDIRAEPIVALYEREKVYHVGTMIRDEGGQPVHALQKLDDEMTTWVPHEGPSPNRVDALVHGATELGRNVMPAAIANPNDVLRHMRGPTMGDSQAS